LRPVDAARRPQPPPPLGTHQRRWARPGAAARGGSLPSGRLRTDLPCRCILPVEGGRPREPVPRSRPDPLHYDRDGALPRAAAGLGLRLPDLSGQLMGHDKAPPVSPSLLPSREKVDRAQRETDEGAVTNRKVVSSQRIKSFAKTLRRRQTDAESKMWS